MKYSHSVFESVERNKFTCAGFHTRIKREKNRFHFCFRFLLIFFCYKIKVNLICSVHIYMCITSDAARLFGLLHQTYKQDVNLHLKFKGQRFQEAECFGRDTVRIHQIFHNRLNSATDIGARDYVLFQKTVHQHVQLTFSRPVRCFMQLCQHFWTVTL